jgi:DNA-binding NarL/FixJ family response regulator/class 3 adenylate cyclase
VTELPTGTVTFLFSDIEGSTQILRRLGDDYADLLDDHQRLLREAFERCGGREMGTEGDSFFVVFRRASEAVAAALAGQRALAEYEWPDGLDVRVRMGIDTGEVSVADERYLGMAVHRAARICSIAHGGQVLVSPATLALVEDPDGEIKYRGLGPQNLRGFDRPVAVYQVEAPGLAKEFAPLRTSESSSEAPFAGRETELAAAGQRAVATRNGSGPQIKILLVDDQALVRAGFRMILEAETDMEVVGEAADGTEALIEARRLKPDVVLMDVRMPELDGIEAARRLLAGEGGPRIVMLTTFDMDEYVYEALRAGASGFLLKDVPPEQLVAGIRAVASGEALLAPAVTKRVIEEFVRRPPDAVRVTPPELAELTDRELEVLQLIARGLSNAEIAKELFVSDTTVKTHVARILMKLRLRDRVQAVVFAYESGLIQPGAGAA